MAANSLIAILVLLTAQYGQHPFHYTLLLSGHVSNLRKIFPGAHQVCDELAGRPSGQSSVA